MWYDRGEFRSEVVYARGRMKQFKQFSPTASAIDLYLKMKLILSWVGGLVVPRLVLIFRILAGLLIRVNPSLDVGTNQTGHLKICLERVQSISATNV